MEKKTSGSFFSSTTEEGKTFKGWPCNCGHIRGLHRPLTAYLLEEEHDAVPHDDFLCVCGCTRYQAMDNLKYVETVHKMKQKKEKAC